MTTEPPRPPVPKDRSPDPYGLTGATWGRQPRPTFAIGPLPKAAPPPPTRPPSFAYVAPIPAAPPPRSRILTDTLAPVAVQRPVKPPPEPAPNPEPAPPPTPFIVAPVAPKPSSRPWLPWVLGAGGALVAGGAIILVISTGRTPLSDPAPIVAAPSVASEPAAAAVVRVEPEILAVVPSQPPRPRRQPATRTPSPPDITPAPLMPPPLVAPALIAPPPISAPVPVDPEAAMTTRAPNDL